MPSRLTLVDEALDGLRGEDQQRIASVGMSLLETILKKNRDYGSSVWKRPIIAPDMPVAAAIRCRMSDKISRLIQLIENGKAEVEDESFNDTLGDLVAYGILYLAKPTVPMEQN